MINQDFTREILRSQLLRGRAAIVSQKTIVDAMHRRRLDTNEAERVLGCLISSRRILRRTLADLEHKEPL